MSLPGKVFAAVAQHLQFARLVTEAVLTQTSHDLVHGLSRRLVFVEKVTSEKDHIDVASLGELHDFVESLPAIVATNRIAFIVANMIVSGNEYANGIGCCVSLW